MVPVSILSKDLSKPALLLFIAMSGHADGETRRCYASLRTLAAELDWWYGKEHPDTRRVRVYRDELEDAKLIKRAGRHVWADAHWTDQWIVAPYLPVYDDMSHEGDDTSHTPGVDQGVTSVSSDTAVCEIWTPPDGDDTSHRSDPVSDPSSNPLLREQVRALGLEPLKREPETEADWNEKRALTSSPEFLAQIAEEEARKAKADAS
jgi:hypothetical protein